MTNPATAPVTDDTAVSDGEELVEEELLVEEISIDGMCGVY
jgi:mycofactocin precursor